MDKLTIDTRLMGESIWEPCCMKGVYLKSDQALRLVNAAFLEGEAKGQMVLREGFMTTAARSSQDSSSETEL